MRSLKQAGIPGLMTVADLLMAAVLVMATILSMAGLLLSVPAPVVAQDADWCRDDAASGRTRICQVEHFTMASASDHMEVDARPNGSVTVEGWNGSEVEVTARIRTRSWRRGAAETLAQQVLVNAVDNRIWVEGPRRTGLFGSWSVDLRVRVPRGTHVEGRSTNGAVRVSGVGGSANATTTNGAIQILEARGSVEARSTNGAIRVKLASPPSQTHRIDLRTTNGGIQVELPPGSSPRLDARTTNGGISSDFTLTQGEAQRRRWTGVLGDGSAVGELRLQTTNGAIHVGQSQR